MSTVFFVVFFNDDFFLNKRIIAGWLEYINVYQNYIWAGAMMNTLCLIFGIYSADKLIFSYECKMKNPGKGQFLYLNIHFSY